MTYSPGLGETICDLIAEGRSLRSIARRPDMPCAQTIHEWLNKHDKFRERFLVAKGLGIDQMVEHMLDIADDTEGDVNRDRLRVDTRKWYAARLAPKIYGDRTTHAHTGGDGEELKITVEPGEAVRRILFALNLGKKQSEDGNA